jgi:hypothetical protein
MVYKRAVSRQSRRRIERDQGGALTSVKASHGLLIHGCGLRDVRGEPICQARR